jgi:predicted O-methyltransferase YrrM
MEIGVWRGDRALLFLELGLSLERYVGFDLFEDISQESFEAEGMGRCTPSNYESVNARLIEAKHHHTSLELIKGDTRHTLPEFVESCDCDFDFILIDGGHSLETVENDWKYASIVLADDGVCIFDDYYLEDDKVGCKRLIDELDTEKWDKDFFRTITRTTEGHYITMVAISKK